MHEAAGSVQVRSGEADAAIAQEQERVNCAKKTAQSFIEVLERDIRGHLELLESLKNRDMSLELIPPPGSPSTMTPKISPS